MRSILFGTSAVALAEAGSLKLTWKDCGGGTAIGTMTGLTPDSVTLGVKTTVTGSGTTTAAVSGGTFELDMKASIISQKFTGDLCSAKTFNLPLGAGSFGWDGVKCPVAVGNVNIPVDISLASNLPSALQSVQLTMSGTDSSGADLLCMQMNTSPAEEEVHTAGMPDCSSKKCPTTCSCVESKCGSSMYSECTADSQCNTLMTCLLQCSCGNVLCALGCVAGKTLDAVAEKVKSCASPCASSSEWEDFKRRYKKSYKSATEESERYKLFMESKKRVEKLNKLNGQPAFGLNWVSDRYETEKHQKGHRKPKDFKPTAPVQDFTKTMRSPASIDWRYTKAVTPVKNQGQCGSCWAFSATEAIESQMILNTGAKYDFTLSPQQIASCTPDTGTYGCDGCNGGFTEGAYEYVKSAPGLANGFYIPYAQSLTESESTVACPTAKVNAITGEYEELSGSYAQVSGYSYAVTPCTSGGCTSQNLKGFAAALEKTPLSICVNAGVWNDYTGGVLTSAACGSMAAADQDHCVMAVGFNSTASTPYWIVRNSWATTWGDEGYIYLEMAKNTCGLADDATIPEVKVDMTEQEASEATARKEAMYQIATRGPALAEAVKVLV